MRYLAGMWKRINQPSFSLVQMWFMAFIIIMAGIMSEALYGAIDVVFADVTAEIKDVIQDPVRGSIIVQTEYKIDGKVVQNGQTRYLETSGTNEEIIAKAKADVKEHCDNLVRRIEANRTYINDARLTQQKSLTTPVIEAIDGLLIGYKESSYEVTDEFKGKNIKVTTDGKNAVSAVLAVE